MKHVAEFAAFLVLLIVAQVAVADPPLNLKGGPMEGYDYEKYLFKVEVDQKRVKPSNDLDASLVRTFVLELRRGYELPTNQKLKGQEIATPRKPGTSELETEADAAKIGTYVFVEITGFRRVTSKDSREAMFFKVQHRMAVRTKDGWRDLFNADPITYAFNGGISLSVFDENPLALDFPRKVLPIRITGKKKNKEGVYEITASITNRFIYPIKDFKPVVVFKSQPFKGGVSTWPKIVGSLSGKIDVAPEKTVTFTFTAPSLTAGKVGTIDGILATEVQFAK